MNNATKRLAQYAANIKFEDIPDNIVLSAKSCIKDSIACMLGGTTTKPGRQVIELIIAMGGRKESTVPGEPIPIPAPYAAYINGFLANACDMDDNYFGMGHPAPAIVPTALALGESGGLSGADLISAVVVGYEIAIRVGKSMLPMGIINRNVRGQSTWMIFGSIAVAGRLMNFNTQQMATAFGIAATKASVPFLAKLGYRDRPMNTIKNNFGWSCMGAILAAELTNRGFLGTTSILEGENGFWRMAGASWSNWEGILDNIGEKYEISLIQFKKYPSCYGTHPAIEGMSMAMQKLPTGASEIKKVIVSGPKKLLDFKDYDPIALTDSQFSIPYVLALLMKGKEPGPEWWDEKNIHDSEILAEARKVEIHHVPSFEEEFNKGHLQTEVTIYTKKGHTYSGFGQIPLSEGKKGLDEKQLNRKFKKLAAPVIDPIGVEKIIDLIDNLEKLRDIRKLMRMLRGI
jgi:2-methylcitrate dehydratase PrpD